MPDFRNFYSIDDLAAYRALDDAYIEKQSEETPEQEAKISAWIESLRTFGAALDRFVRAKAEAGELAEIPFVADRGLRWADRWNRLVTGTENQWDQREGLLNSGSLMVLTMACLPKKDHPELSLTEKHDNLVAQVNDGKHIEPSSAYGTCDRTGQTLYMQMASGWKPQYGTFDKQHNLVPLQTESPALAVQHNTIPVPSGELLFNDWFRIEGFNEALERKGGPDVNTLVGRWASTAHSASHGLMSVWVGNTSPQVLQRDGQIVVASGAYDDELGDNVALPGRTVGSICTDLWCASAVDREVLTELVARSAGREVAERRVADYLEEHSHTVRTVQLPPGSTLHIYHMDHGLHGFECDEVDATGTDPLYLVASLAELEWKPVSDKKPSPRP